MLNYIMDTKPDHSVTVFILPEKKEIEPPKMEIMEVNKTPEITKEEFQEYATNLHKLLDNIVDLASKTWGYKELDYGSLIVRDKNEYVTLLQYRRLKKIQDEYLSKNVCDLLITKENQIFESRNEGKEKHHTHRVEKEERLEKLDKPVKIEKEPVIEPAQSPVEEEPIKKKKVHFWTLKKSKKV